EKLPNHIRRLEDTDGDGRFDKSSIFADKMTFPMGALWHDGYVYTASPPHIWRLRDTDDDGIADERKILVSEFGFTGNAADIHGCFLGPEGRIYWCDGRHGHNFTDEQGNSLSKGLAARIFSCKPDGSDVRAFAGGGMDNPVEICFTEEGEMLGTVAIFDNKPDRVDAIVHWVYGGAYPYHEKVLGEFKRTGDLLPAVSRFGRVAPSGILRYRGKHLGDEYTNDLFHAQFNTHRVVRTKLTRKGASFTSVDEDFLVSENQDVHLTDVIEDADGSLLVVDTGGWFRIGCPNSQIAKPDILGGIYRIRRTGAPKMDDPRGQSLIFARLPIDELFKLLGDERPAVRTAVKEELVSRGTHDRTLCKALFDRVHLRQGNPDVDVSLCRELIWLAARLGESGLLRGFLAQSRDSDASLVLSALMALSSFDSSQQYRAAPFGYADVATLNMSKDEAIRREAATAIGRNPQSFGISGASDILLKTLESSNNDRFLEHAVIFALIEGRGGPAIFKALESPHPNVRRGALIALDQIGTPELTRDLVVPLLDTNDAALLSTVVGIMQKHADWAPAVVDWLKSRLANTSLSGDQLQLVQNTLLAYKADPAIQQLLADALTNTSSSVPQRVALLEVVEQAELTGKQTPAVWNGVVAAQLASNDEPVVRQAIAAARVLGSEAFREPLLAIVRELRGGQSLMIAALKALGPAAGEPDGQTFKVLTDSLTASSDPLDRLAAADCLSKLPLSTNQRATIVEVVAAAGPLELPALLGVFEKSGSAEEGQQLAAALAKSPGLANLTVGQVEKLFERYPSEVRSAAEPILHKLNA
ncbi:MAG: HEAT repeat domain-containing protein, partial [Planctomycetales bacterium]|nr:HEAT repeat domain-containing protein [Planctomycetales bacterium]